MSTLAEIEEAVAGLSPREQETLLRKLTSRLHPVVPAAQAERRWPVQPPKVSKAESRRVNQRIEKEFGRIETENWK